MQLEPGTELGHYEIVSSLGSGGMGEVYRARDTRLGREVALKVLPEAFAEDPARMARFEREARLLASLKHPGIATLYGFESEGATQLLVMEVVEGETLAERIQRGPIPIDQAIALFLQIAEALDVAHTSGVIHRDLKPANIKVSEEGEVKILDFGLAKAMAPEEPEAELDPSDSPTLTMAATQRGEVMGTAAYMSPEQAKGKRVDRRADVWAFGACLLETLTGERAFRGLDASELMASVLMLEPAWEALPESTPPRLRELLRRCLEKDPRRRLRDIGDAVYELEQGLASPDHEAQHGQPEHREPDDRVSATPRSAIRWLGLAAAALAGAILAGLIAWNVRPPPEAADRVVRTVLSGAGNPALRWEPYVGLLDISRDGRWVAYAADEGIHVRSLDELEGGVVAEGGRSPFFSPDGQWVGFMDSSGGAIEKVPVRGGPVITISDTSTALAAIWADDDTIVFHEGNTGFDLSRVSASGGEPREIPIVAPEGFADLRWPHLLPGGKVALVTLNRTAIGDRGVEIAALDLETGELRTLVPDGGRAVYTRNGFLVYGQDGALMAVPFDPETLSLGGSPVPVLERVMTKSLSGGADFAISDDGTLVYASGQDGAMPTTATFWVNRDGKKEPIEEVRSLGPRFSPDGTRVAFTREENLWIWELDRDEWTRLTFAEGLDNNPLWTPDGASLYFAGNRGGRFDIYQRSADGSGQDRLIWKSRDNARPLSIVPRTSELIIQDGTELGVLSLGEEPSFEPLFEVDAMMVGAMLSPDGRWLAFNTTESEQSQVFVHPYPEVQQGRWQISSAGGRFPLWSRDGAELLYQSTDGTSIMRVSVDTREGFRSSSSQLLFETRMAPAFARGWDLHPDLERFLVSERTGDLPAPPDVVLVQNFFSELERLDSRR